MTTSTDGYALSIRQPWAALLVSGVKTVEVRKWNSHRTGPVYIHASTIVDERPEAWQWVTTESLHALTNLRGGVIGVGELTGCVRYDTEAKFVQDRGRHLNEPDWYVAAGLFGLTFRDLRQVPFVRYPGNTYFFRVNGLPPP